MGDEAPHTPTLLPQVDQRLRHARALLRSHGGDVVVEADDDGEVTLEFVGACRGCPAKAFTLAAVVAPVLEETAGVTAVRAPQVNAAPAVLERIRSAARPRPTRADDPDEHRPQEGT